VGGKLASLAVNTDPRRIETTRRYRSVGAQAALGRQWATPQLIRSTIAYLVDRVAGRLRAARRAGRTVNVRVRFTDLRSVTRALTLPVPISATLTLTDVAVDLVSAALGDHPEDRQITLLGVSVTNLAAESALQLELPFDSTEDWHRPGTRTGATRWGVDRSVDAVRSRFGRQAVGYGAVMMSDVRSVPDGLRELAERNPPRD
jgi:DNA polymerase-4